VGRERDMRTATRHEGRLVRGAAQARSLLWGIASLILLFNALLVAWVLLKPASDAVVALVLNVAEFVGPLLVLPLCFGGLRRLWRRGTSQTAGGTAVSIGQRWAPVLLGIGILSFAFGQIVFTYYEWVLQQAPPLPSLADVGFQIQYPFLLLGILLLSARPIPAASRARIALDGLIIMTALVTLSWYFVLGPVVQQEGQTTLAKVVAVAQPLADVVLVACLLILASRPSEHTLRPALRLLALGLALVVVADSYFTYHTLHDTYATGSLLDIGWPLGYMLVALGAFVARLALSGERATTSPEEQPANTPRGATPLAEQRVWRSLLPYVLVPVVGILVVYVWRTSSTGSDSLAAGVYVGGALLIGLVLLRQVDTIVRDITERKRSEEALKKSEARHRAVVDTALDAIVTMSADGLIRSFNHSAELIFGYTAEEAIGQRLEMLMPERFRKLHRAGLRRYLNTGEAHVIGQPRLELAGRRKDGTEFPLELSLSETREGEDTLFIGIVRDITERKRSEEELKESEERFKRLAEATFEGVAITQDGKVVETNASFAAMFRYESSEVIGMTPADFHPPESQGVVRSARSSRLEEPYEAVCLRKDGTTFEGEIRGKMFSYKGHPVRVTAIRDITERKRAEEALKQSEQLYRTVIEQAAENICLVDAETKRIVESNPAFQETLGYTEEELRHMTLYDIVAHDRASVDRNMRRVRERKHYYVGERKYRRKDGSLVDVEASGSMILLDGRESLCIVAHDITERARVQELLEERVATLSGIAASLTLDLPVGDTLDVLAEGVVNASTAVASLVILTGEETDTLRPAGSHGLPEGFTAGLQAAYSAGAQSPTLEAFRRRRPMLVRDFRRFVLDNPLYAPIHHFVREAPWDTLYIVPLISRGRALGTINLYYLPEQEPGEDEKVFLGAVADQTAVAVENVRLFAGVRDKAALEERQRLARELHDSVSQALYGITLGTKTARTLLDKNPDRVADPLDYVLSLAEAGQAEMRALIFELRPESLETEGLIAALEKQAAALKARHRIEVDAVLCYEPKASLEAKEAVYRIAQEALHNTVKHARAANVQIKMECDSEWITLEVSDDGIGFDAQGDFPGHLGLRSMRERALRLGGTLEVDSTSGKGTRICAQVPI
jgi:PAS domain S-box-containing protein